MINLICQTNKCKKYIVCNNWICFFDKLTIFYLVQPDFQANLRK